MGRLEFAWDKTRRLLDLLVDAVGKTEPCLTRTIGESLNAIALSTLHPTGRGTPAKFV